MTFRHNAFVLCLFVLCVCLHGFQLATSVSAQDRCLTWKTTPEGVTICEGDQPVLFYQRTAKSKDGKHSRANYVHPLYDLDGNVLTEDFPDDHKHHRGVFWAWHQLKVGSQSVGDGWAISDFSWDVRQLMPHCNSDGSISLNLVVDWKSPKWKDGREAVVVETSTIRIYPSQPDRRLIDFDIRLRATNPETLIGGSNDVKGYGGFSVRIKLPRDIRFTGQSGEATPETTAVAPSPWMSMTGSLGDPPTTQPSGLTVLCHPSSAGFPQPWILRSARSMQNPVWPGRELAALPNDEPVSLRYRIVIHRHEVEPEHIDRWQDEYAALP